MVGRWFGVKTHFIYRHNMLDRKILQLGVSSALSLSVRFFLPVAAAIFLSGCFFSFHKGVTDLNGSSPGNVTVQFSSPTSSGIDTVPVYSVAAVLSAPSSSTVTVDYAVTGGTAVNGVDYTLSSGTLTFPAGATSELITINITNEGAGFDKTIDLQLSNPVNATLDVQSTHVHTITYVKHIYRSVGPSNTSILACGTTGSGCTGQGTLTISGTTATFAAAVPDRIGVGDAIVYDCSGDSSLGAGDCIAFISGRTSSTVYTVQDKTGSTPMNYGPASIWRIYRAYTSLADAVDSSSGGTENASITAIDANLGNFDSWSGGTDLVTANQQLSVALYGDAADTSAVNISGWTTSSVNNIKIYAPYLSTEVGVSQRFTGVWDDTRARIQYNDVNNPFQVGNDCWLDGIQIQEIVSSVTFSNLFWAQGTSAINVRLSDNLFMLDNPSNLSENNIVSLGSNTTVAGTSFYVWNNIIANESGNNATGIYTYHNGTTYAFNNTVVNASIDFGADASGGSVTVYAKNNIAQGCGSACYSTNNGGIYDPSSGNNIASDATAAGSSALNNKTVSFVNSAVNDYRLSPSDTTALDAGTDLSADTNLAFSTDISNISRPQGTAWDIGASEVLAATSNETEMLTLSFSAVYHAGFTATASFAGDNNANNSANIYYCDATSTPGCDPLSGTSATMSRTAGQFTYYAENLANSNTDTYNVEVVAADADGLINSPVSGTVTLLGAPTQIYRSIGPGNTSVLACGGGDGSGCANIGGTLTLSGSSATFASALPNNIGVGDAIVYDCSGNSALGAGDCIAFIRSRTSGTVFTVEDKSGANPTAYAAATVWRIYRAYTSLSDTGNSNNLENASIRAIDATLGNFDNWSGRDMLANNEQWNFAIYADGVDTMPDSGGEADYSSWTSTPSNYLRIYTPYLPAEVGVSQRHSGKWDTTKAIIDINFGTTVNGINAPNMNIWIDGLQAYAYGYWGAGGSNFNLFMTQANLPTVQRISNNIIKSNNNVANGNSDMVMVGGGSAAGTSTVEVWNNIIYDLVDGIRGIENDGPSKAFVYNNTLVNSNIIANSSDSRCVIVAKNNISANYTNWSSASFDPSSTNNLAYDGSAPGTSPLNNKTVTFVNSSSNDYRLSPSDTSGAIDGGVDLSADPNVAFNTDLANIPRPQGAGWDVGASEAMAASSNATEMLKLTFSAITSSGFTATATFAGDNNANNAATIYYCDATSTPGCSPLSGASSAMTRAAGQFTASPTGLANSGTDTYNVEVVAADSDGVTGSPFIGTVTLLPPLKLIYRSVGPGNTSSLASGTSNALTISGSTATFASAIPINIGVGDAVVYNSNADIAFIAGRTDSTHYTLQSANGGTPTAVAGDTTWNIYRAYTSIEDAYIGDGNENSGIPAGVRGFEIFTGRANNLVTSNYQWNIAIYGDGADGYTPFSGGWQTSSTNYLKVYAPYLSTEVGSSQRTTGTWDNTKARILVTDNSGFYVSGSFVWIDGLEIGITSSAANFNAGIVFTSGGSASNNLIQMDDASMSAYGIQFYYSGGSKIVYAWNNIITNSNSNNTTFWGILGASTAGTSMYLYNNTIVNGYYGINGGNSTVLAKNNIVQGATNPNGYGATWAAGSDYNISNDTTSPGGANDSTNTTVTFADPSQNDYLLSPTDTTAVDGGIDLSADPNIAFGTDIAGISRPQGAGWDIGASEALANSSNATQMLALTFRGVTLTGFTATATFQGDANANNSAIIYFCDNTASPGCDALLGTSAAMIRSSGTFTFTAAISSGHAYNVKVVASDADGVYGSPLSATLGEEIFRSVGPGDTSALASGAANALTISGSTATFASAIPSKVGVGDAVVYASNTKIAFIMSRASSTQYTLQTATGGVPTAATGDTTWAIYRAYTSLCNAVCSVPRGGSGSGHENSGIPAAVQNFDSYSGGIDLVAANQIWNYALYADGVDTTPVDFNYESPGWNTSSADYVRLFTPYLPTDVGVSQRHNGAWTSLGYQLVVDGTSSAAYWALLDGGQDIILDGLQIELDRPNASGGAALRLSESTGYWAKASNNIIRTVNTGGKALNGIDTNYSDEGADLYIWNNIIYGFTGNAGDYCYWGGDGNIFLYNNTMVGCYNGVYGDPYYASMGKLIATNNIVQGATVGHGYGDLYPASLSGDYNVSNDTTSPGGTHDIKSAAVTFVYSSGSDYRLSPTDASGALDGGADLSADPNLAFSVDISGVARPQGAGWDVGASEAVQSTSNNTEMLTLTFSGIGTSGFSATATFSGDNNANNSATIYYCDATSTPGCSPLSGSSAAMTRAAGQFTYSATGLANSGTDTYNVEVVTTDADGVSSSPLSGTVTLLAPAKQIYRSVGPGNTSILACGTTGGGCTGQGNLTISGSTATFAAPIANNIGVGDAIVYDCSGDAALGAGDCIAFISGRTDSTHYAVEDKAGATPSAYSAAAVWRIYRAYTSISDAVDSSNGGTENASISAIDATLGNFDTWTGGADLVTANEQWNVAVYGDATDAYSGTAIDVSAWTTSSLDYLNIYAPHLATEVGSSQRHSGFWDSTKYNISLNQWSFSIANSNVVVDGLQISQDGTANGRQGFAIIASGITNVTVRNCLIRFTSASGSGGNSAIGIGQAASSINIYNNIIYGSTSSLNSGIDYGDSSNANNSILIYNNTITGAAQGINSWSNKAIAKNNIVVGNTTDFSNSADFGASSVNNISSDASSPNAALQNKTVTFVNAAANDYRLSPSDTSALDAGADLSADPNLAFNTDISGIARPQGAAWDIGASEALAAGSSGTELLTLAFSGVTSSGFTATATFAGDNNASNAATIYYCDATSMPGCSPLSGTSASMTRAAGQFTNSPTGLTNSGTDTYNVEVVATDTDGISGSPLTGTVTLTSGGATTIYRSVGPSNTTALSTGASNAVTISGTTATFTTALPNNIGVGDAIVYNSNANIAFISGRTDSTHYTVQSASGGTPTAASADTTWSIYRAYTSLSNAVAGTENTGIPAGVRNFDAFSSNNNLVTANVNWNIACYADAADTAAVVISGWTTNSTHKLKIFAPYLASEVGVSQRHPGLWSSATSAYTLAVSSEGGLSAMVVRVANVTIDGLQIDSQDTANYSAPFEVDGTSYPSTGLVLSNNIFRSNDGAGTNEVGIFIDTGTSDVDSIYNNVIYYKSGGGSPGNGFEIASSTGTVYAYNNTVNGYNFNIVNDGSATALFKNTISINSVTVNAYYGTFAAGSDYNLSSNAMVPAVGTHNITNASPTFINAANGDFRLSSTDTKALDAGEDLSADSNISFSTDIAGISRPQGTAWDIGASEGILGTSNATQVTAMSFSSISHTGFATLVTFGGDANANNSATMYYCDATSTPGCSPLSGSSASMTRAAGQFSYTATGLTNAGSDTYNVEVVASDSDGISGSPIDSSVTLSAAPGTPIYRSVGPADTSILACGTTGGGCSGQGTLTISSTTATFASAAPNNIGVGDAIVYDCSGDLALGSGDCIAFITGRTDSTHYSVEDHTGATPTAYAAGSVWRIYRAYTSLNDAVTFTENASISAIDATLGNFDNFTTRNLSTNNEQWNLALYADADDSLTATVDFTNFTNSTATDYVRIYSPYLASEVGISQRHSGSWAGGGYHISGGCFSILLKSDYLRLEGIRLDQGTCSAITFGISIYANNDRILDNIIKYSGNGSETTQADAIAQGATGISFYVYNNIIIDWKVTAAIGYAVNDGYDVVYAFNNTIVNCDNGIGVYNSGTGYVKNNIVQSTPTAYQAASGGVFDSSSDYNISGTATATGGAHDQVSKTVSFVNAAVEDYRLSPSDASALDAGSDLSAYPNLAFNTDISGIARPQGAAWDIGASEAMAASSNGTEMLTLTFSPIFHTGFSAKATFQGDNNANNSAVIYYCDATSTPGCSPLGGSSAAMTRASGNFTAVITGLSNSGTDTYNVEVVAIDADGVYGSPLTGTATLLTVPTQIYRSVGENNTSALASGISNAVTISGTAATFTTALPDNIGIGDAIVYNSNTNIAFISGRTDSTHYTLQDKAGATPTAASGDTTWNIYRAYTSLNNAIGQSGSAGGTENTAIPAGVRNFDTWSVGTDLVAANEVWNVDLYADAPFDVTGTNGITLNYWTLSPDNYLNIYVPYLPTEVGVSQRHSGKWDSSKVYITASVGSNLQEWYIWGADYLRFDGLQMQVPDTGVGPNTAIWMGNAVAATSDYRISNCIINIVNGSGGGGTVNEYGIMNLGGTIKAWNNIIYCTGSGTDQPDGIAANTGDSVFTYQYNNTVYGCYNGIQSGSSTYFVTKNNISCGNTYKDYRGGTTGTHTNNISCDASSPDAAYASKTVTFVNAAGNDYRLSPTDASARDAGVDLSADPNIAFNSDIVGISRPQGVAWDIGASEAIAASSNATEMLTLTFSGVTSNGWTATATFAGDNNATNAATLYYCDNSLSPGCSPLTGTSAAMTRAAGQFTYTATSLLPDAYNVEVVATDADGISGSPLTGTVGATQIFRSVGPGNTSVMACGGGDGSGCTTVGGNLTISGVNATFATPIASNIGVGDAIVYDCSGNSSLGASDCVAFITERTDNQHYVVKAANGAAPTAYAAANVWRIYRAYTSLANAVAGTENSAITAIDATLGNFDNWSNGTNLTAANEQWNIACYADATDTTQVIASSSWVTGPSNYLRIYTPYLSAEVGVSQRHNGSWSSGGYLLSKSDSTGSTGVFESNVNFLYLDGLKIDNTYNGVGGAAFFNGYGYYNFTGAGAYYISNNLFAQQHMGAGGTAIVMTNNNTTDASMTYYVWNNIFFGTNSISSNNEVGFNTDSSATYYVYNNTFVNVYDAVATWAPMTLKNNIAQNCTNGPNCWAYGLPATGFAAGSDYNVASFGTTGGAHDKTNATVAFLDAPHNDYRLSSGDTIARAAGTNLSADPNLAFTTDIAGGTRPSTWDVGASQSASSVSDNNIFVTGITAWPNSETSISARLTFYGDANGNAAATLYYCDKTKNAYCDPLSNSVVMTRNRSDFTATATLAPASFSPGDTILVTAIATDADGVSGSPVSTTTVLAPQLNINNVTATAGSTVTFTVSLSAAMTTDVTFNYSTADGSAWAGTHYTAASGSATILAGQTSVNLPAVTTTTAGHDKYFSMVISNISGAAAGTIVGTATLNAYTGPLTKIYRSVGPGNTAVLACGGGDGSGCVNVGGNLSISGTAATFASALPNNIGVGDAVVYDCSGDSALGAGDCIAFVTGRTDSTHYALQNAAGAAPTAYAAATVWRIYRAYTTLWNLFDASTTQAGPIANSSITAIDATLGAFDSWNVPIANGGNGGRDIVAANEQWNVAMYADALDTNANSLTLNGWVTSANNYIKIYAPSSSTEVGVSQRHVGYYDGTKAGFTMNDVGGAFALSGYIWLDGLQFHQTLQTTQYNTFFTFDSQNTYISKMSNCIFDMYVPGGSTSTNVVAFAGGGGMSPPGSAVYFWNNIISNMSCTNCDAADFHTEAYVYNNTIYNSVNGITVTGIDGPANGVLKNNLISGGTTGYQTNYNATFDSSSTNNLSSDSTAPGLNAQLNKSVTFVNSAGDNYLLAAADTSARGQGVDLSADSTIPFSTDIQNLQRTDPWDIGAARVGNTASGNGVTLVTLDTTSTTTGFTANVPFTGDDNQNATATLYYCNNTTSPGCNPTTGSNVVMTRQAGIFTASVAGLVPATYNPGDVLNISVIASDTDGVTNSPLTGTVGLYPTISIANASVLGGNNMQFTVSLSATTANNVTFNYATADGTATSASDYTTTSGSGTITAGSTSTTITVPTTTNGDNVYFTMTLSTIANADAGRIVATGTIVNPVWGLQLVSLATSNVSQDGFTANLTYSGDQDRQSTITLWYCDATNTPGCDPSTGASATMTQVSSSIASAVVSGLASPINPGDTLNLAVTAVDTASGVIGSPVTGTVTLLSTNAIAISNLQTSAIVSDGFTAQIDFTGDSNSNATVALDYCNVTVNGAGCSPSTSLGAMTRGSGVYTLTVSGLVAPDNPGDTLKISVVPTDTDGTSGSITGTVTLATGGNTLTLGALTTTDVQNDRFITEVGFTGDANDNSTATLYYCDNTQNPGCSPTGSGTSVSMVRGLTHFVAEVDNLISPILPGDTLNLAVTANDTDGVTGSPVSGTVTLSSAKNIFRSIGAGNTLPLASGAATWSLSISGTTATFTLPLPGNIGVGDVIQYHASGLGSTYNTLAVISGRLSSTSYIVESTAGGTPTATSAATSIWQIYRAYTGLSKFNTLTQNTGICSAVTTVCAGALTVDNWAGSRNIATNGEKWMIAEYADGIDTLTANVTFSKFTGATATNYIELFSPYSVNHVGVSQRHNGSFDIVGATIDGYGYGLRVGTPYFRLEGLVMQTLPNCCNNSPAIVNLASNYNFISQNIFWSTIVANSGISAGISPTATGRTAYIINNEFSGFQDAQGFGYGILNDGGTFYVFNNTIANSQAGIVAYDGGTTLAIDNIVQSSTDSYVTSNRGGGSFGTWTSGSDFNVSDTSESTGGYNDLTNSRDRFVNANNLDLRLSGFDPYADGTGESLADNSIWPFVSDVTGTPRTAAKWDRGASVTASARTVNSIQVYAPYFSDVQNDRFTVQTRFAGDSDANAIATLYYCDQTVSPGCTPQSGIAVPMARGKETFIANIEDLVSPSFNPGDVISVAVNVVDPDGVTEPSASATLTLQNVKNIFRSIGPASTAALATGNAGNQLTIIGSAATFSGSGVPNNVGVGDVIQYDSSASGLYNALAVISGRASNTSFYVLTSAGATPSATTGATSVWQIYRAYTSLNNAMIFSENTGICNAVSGSCGAALRNFDNFSSRALSTNNEKWNLALYADSADSITTPITFTKYTSPTSTQYVRLFTPTSPNHVGISQRHNGSWDGGGYYVDFGGGNELYPQTSYARIEGLLLQFDQDNSGGGFIIPKGNGLRFANNIIKDAYSDDTSAINFDWGVTSVGTQIYNNIFLDWRGRDNEAVDVNLHSYTNAYIFNNTTVNSNNFLWNNGAQDPVWAANNLIQSTDIAFGKFVQSSGFGLTIYMPSGFNLEDDSTSLGLGLDYTNISNIEFLDGNLNDARLSGTDTSARAKGSLAVTDAFPYLENDISGHPRDGSVDAGASQAVDAHSNAVAAYDLSVTATSQTTLGVSVSYQGDYNANSTAVAYYCDRTANSLCEPTSSGLSVSLSSASSTYSGSITGLTHLHNYAVTVVITDTDGAYGTPLRATQATQ